MLLNLLSRYLANIENAISTLADSYVEHYNEEIITANRINLKIRIRFSSGHLLELNEAVIVEEGNIKHLSYPYHFQDGQNNLVFRYDNTPHFQEIESFPHHKHIQNEVIDADRPSILHVIEEASLIAQ
jgi:hypothetical protein